MLPCSTSPTSSSTTNSDRSRSSPSPPDDTGGVAPSFKCGSCSRLRVGTRRAFCPADPLLVEEAMRVTLRYVLAFTGLAALGCHENTTAPPPPPLEAPASLSSIALSSEIELRLAGASRGGVGGAVVYSSPSS